MPAPLSFYHISHLPCSSAYTLTEIREEEEDAADPGFFPAWSSFTFLKILPFTLVNKCAGSPGQGVVVPTISSYLFLTLLLVVASCCVLALCVALRLDPLRRLCASSRTHRSFCLFELVDTDVSYHITPGSLGYNSLITKKYTPPSHINLVSCILFPCNLFPSFLTFFTHLLTIHFVSRFLWTVEEYSPHYSQELSWKEVYKMQ